MTRAEAQTKLSAINGLITRAQDYDNPVTLYLATRRKAELEALLESEAA